MKSPWEARVGMLLDSRLHPEFAWSYKPYDSALYGGQPRIDWIACDCVGLVWVIEVKTLGPKRKTLNLESDLSAGQIQILRAVGNTSMGVALLAVAQGSTLYWFDWRKIQWLLGFDPVSLLPMTESFAQMTWSGPKKWGENNLYQIAQKQIWYRVTTSGTGPPLPAPFTSSPPPAGSLFGMPVMLIPSESVLLDGPAPPSPSISKPKGSIRTRRRKLLSGPLLSKPPE